ncbi:hypothetical protein OlisA3_0043 [Streptococcus phage OlisA3]|nr:hypothetical protein OlisA3_0043 [Streptococcus phage OlisA3]
MEFFLKLWEVKVEVKLFVRLPSLNIKMLRKSSSPTTD